MSQKKERLISFNYEKGLITSISYKGEEICAKESAIFTIRLIDREGRVIDLPSTTAKSVCVADDGLSAVYSCFDEDITVTVFVRTTERGFNLRFKVENGTDKIIEHIESLPLILKPFVKHYGVETGGKGKMLYPYNEGVIVEDSYFFSLCRPYHEPAYPSEGSYGIFPNMVQSQFMAYLFEGKGLYIGTHDEERGLKAINFFVCDELNNIQVQLRLYSGKNYGEDFAPDYDVVYELFDGDWMDGAEIYKKWFYEHLPKGLKKVIDNRNLPEWYHDFPIILTYPVRGYHDTDEMTPNELFPYVNVLPYVDEISRLTGAKIMVILMHWEGTAPWAPPYVFPPYGGEEEFDKLFNALKNDGHFLGVYCSGFSFTEQSNVLPEYHCREMLKDKETFKAFCAGRDGKILHSKICEGQRVGYDLCIASNKGRQILDEAYDPVFAKGLDYVQILDQNHGGGQYFCYSNEHNHPPCVGPWMTIEMNKLLDEWNAKAGKTLLGCESAAAEPFLKNLAFSDNRFEINHCIGTSVPVYSYIYHEFAHNFMGNQVSAMLCADSYLFRMAYSFVAGDMPTLILHPQGFLMSHWGQRDVQDRPDKQNVYTFVKNIREFYMENADFMRYGNMIKPLPYKTEEIVFKNDYYARSYTADKVLSTAFEFGGQKIQIFANYNTQDQEIEFGGKTIVIKALSVVKESI